MTALEAENKALREALLVGLLDRTSAHVAHAMNCTIIPCDCGSMALLTEIRAVLEAKHV